MDNHSLSIITNSERYFQLFVETSTLLSQLLLSSEQISIIKSIKNNLRLLATGLSLQRNIYLDSLGYPWKRIPQNTKYETPKNYILLSTTILFPFVETPISSPFIPLIKEILNKEPSFNGNHENLNIPAEPIGKLCCLSTWVLLLFGYTVSAISQKTVGSFPHQLSMLFYKLSIYFQSLSFNQNQNHIKSPNEEKKLVESFSTTLFSNLDESLSPFQDITSNSKCGPFSIHQDFSIVYQAKNKQKNRKIQRHPNIIQYFALLLATLTDIQSNPKNLKSLSIDGNYLKLCIISFYHSYLNLSLEEISPLEALPGIWRNDFIWNLILLGNKWISQFFKTVEISEKIIKDFTSITASLVVKLLQSHSNHQKFRKSDTLQTLPIELPRGMIKYILTANPKFPMLKRKHSKTNSKNQSSKPKHRQSISSLVYFGKIYSVYTSNFSFCKPLFLEFQANIQSIMIHTLSRQVSQDSLAGNILFSHFSEIWKQSLRENVEYFRFWLAGIYSYLKAIEQDPPKNMAFVDSWIQRTPPSSCENQLINSKDFFFFIWNPLTQIWTHRHQLLKSQKSLDLKFNNLSLSLKLNLSWYKKIFSPVFASYTLTKLVELPFQSLKPTLSKISHQLLGKLLCLNFHQDTKPLFDFICWFNSSLDKDNSQNSVPSTSTTSESEFGQNSHQDILLLENFIQKWKTFSSLNPLPESLIVAMPNQDSNPHTIWLFYWISEFFSLPNTHLWQEVLSFKTSFHPSPGYSEIMDSIYSFPSYNSENSTEDQIRNETSLLEKEISSIDNSIDKVFAMIHFQLAQAQTKMEWKHAATAASLADKLVSHLIKIQKGFTFMQFEVLVLWKNAHLFLIDLFDENNCSEMLFSTCWNTLSILSSGTSALHLTSFQSLFPVNSDADLIFSILKKLKGSDLIGSEEEMLEREDDFIEIDSMSDEEDEEVSTFDLKETLETTIELIRCKRFGSCQNLLVRFSMIPEILDNWPYLSAFVLFLSETLLFEFQLELYGYDRSKEIQKAIAMYLELVSYFFKTLGAESNWSKSLATLSSKKRNFLSKNILHVLSAPFLEFSELSQELPFNLIGIFSIDICSPSDTQIQKPKKQLVLAITPVLEWDSTVIVKLSDIDFLEFISQVNSILKEISTFATTSHLQKIPQIKRSTSNVEKLFGRFQLDFGISHLVSNFVTNIWGNHPILSQFDFLTPWKLNMNNPRKKLGDFSNLDLKKTWTKNIHHPPLLASGASINPRHTSPGNCYIMSSTLSNMCWEHIFSSEIPSSRLPSFSILLELLSSSNDVANSKTTTKSHEITYLVDPENNLQNTRDRLSYFHSPHKLHLNKFGPITWNIRKSPEIRIQQTLSLSKYLKSKDIYGIYSAKPDETQKEHLLNSQCFAYSGHNSGSDYISHTSLSKHCPSLVFLMGCSSGFRHSISPHYSPLLCSPIHYLVNGSKGVFANLWDVTDRECDRITNVLTTQWMFLNGQGIKNFALLAKEPRRFPHHTRMLPNLSASEILIISREVVRFPWLSAGSSVFWGLPNSRFSIYSRTTKNMSTKKTLPNPAMKISKSLSNSFSYSEIIYMDYSQWWNQENQRSNGLPVYSHTN